MIEKVEMNMKKQDLGVWCKLVKPHRSHCDIKDMVGKKVIGIYYDEENFQILTDDGVYAFYHEQDCCESVNLTQVDGISDKIIGSRIVIAEVVTKTGEDGVIDTDEYDSVTWSFYKIGTNKGMIDFRWQGESNGYYSETVDLVKIEV